MVEGTIENESFKLESLNRVIREVDSAPNLEAALRVVVKRTRELMAADVCSIYFTDHDRRRHVIVATDGLAPSIVGRVQIGFGKGLIGRVAEDAIPVHLDHVPEVLDEDFLQQSGVERYHGFLGVPITHRSRVLGVLVVRQKVERRFVDIDSAILTTLAAQLGGAIAYARLSGLVNDTRLRGDMKLGQLEGLAGAPGIAVGIGVLAFSTSDLATVPNRRSTNSQLEEQNLHSAIARVQDELTQLSEDLDGTFTEADRALFEAYTLMLKSPGILDTTTHHIQQGNWAPGALRMTIETYSRRFEEIDDPYLRERSADIRDLGNRILLYLQSTTIKKDAYPEKTILIGRQLSVIDLGLIPRQRLCGIVSAESSALSHVAILARSLGIPAVVGVGRTPIEQLDGQELVVDGNRGRISLRPTPQLRKQVESLIHAEQEFRKDLRQLENLPSQTKDGAEMPLYTNVGLIAELPLAVNAGSAGIGLFRSELPFMLYDRFPSEQEQVEIYRQVLEAVAPLPVNLRTLDVGGDKPLPYLPIVEPNPILGWRGIRLMLDRPEIFLSQLRAALRANIGLGNLRLLLPMVNGLAEVEQALVLIERAHRQLLEEGHASTRPPVGLMIEVPSVIYLVEELARRVDFFSVGTNDLTQYLLAIDRGNHQVSSQLDPLHPAVLRALRQVIEASARAGKPVSVCGEMASDPGSALLLLGLGADSLSVSATALPQVKWAIRSVDFAQMKSLAQKALMLDRPESIRQLVEKTLEEVFPR